MRSESPSVLRAAAVAFISSGELMALDSRISDRVTALVQQVADGSLAADALRAAVPSSGSRSASRPSAKGVAVLELTGLLEPAAGLFSFLGIGTSLRDFMAQLAAAGADPSVRSILLRVDSPGGSIRMVPETAALMRDVRQRTPITVAVTGLDASAAYWISSNATRLDATVSAEIGSIGVYAQRLDATEQLRRDGLTVTTVSAGAYKVEGLPSEPMSEAERLHLQARVDAAYTNFVADVALGRSVPSARVREHYGQGRVMTARLAAQAGMIDRVVTLEQTIARLASGGPPSAVARRRDDAQLVSLQLLGLSK